ncbi:MAG TPA: 50S ribosomal protein L4 [Gemmatimonadaceae bacterium]|jgi:large subunit ribosomal protein L4
MAETIRELDAAAYTGNGTARERVSLPEATFDGTVHMPVMHQAVKAFLANQRQGNAATKTRGKVVGGNQKPWRQKGTGRARQGSIRAPNWVGGGTVFGPSPRSYAEKIPRQVKALARKSAFNARAREGAVVVVDRFEYDAPSTARLATFVDRLGLTGQKVLILTDGIKPNVYRSGRNLPTVHVMPYSDASTYHLLWSDTVVIEGGAIGHQLEPIAETEPEPKPRAKKPAPSAAKKAPTKKATKKAATKQRSSAKKKAPARKTATQKTARKAAAKKTTARKSTTAKKSAARKTSSKPKKGK